MSDNEIKIKASVEDEASSKLNKVGKSVDDLSKKAEETSKSTKGLSTSFVALGVALGNIAFSAITSAIKGLGNAIAGAIKDFAEGEQVTNRLTAALKNQGIYSGYLIKDYENFAKEMRNYSGVADDVIKDNMTLLTNYGLLGDELKRATKTAMSLSVGLGTDLKSATMMLARAAEGNITAFSRYGITIKDTGDKAKNFQEILKGVEEKFGDLANVNANNLNTQVALLQENWKDLKKELAEGVAPTLNTVIQKFNELFKARDVKKENQYIADLTTRQISYYKTISMLEARLAEMQQQNWIQRILGTKLNTQEVEKQIEEYKSLVAQIDNEIKIKNELKNVSKVASDEEVAQRQAELKSIKQKEELEKQAAEETKKRKEKELKTQEEIERKKLDLQVSSQQNVLNNIADLNKSANDYELSEKINYYEKDYQNKIDSLDRQIQARKEAGQTETTDYALLLEQKKSLDEEYQTFVDEKNEIIKEKGTVLHDFNIWLTEDETQKKIQSITALASLQNSKIKEVAAVGKAAAIVDTTISTYQMAVDAYKAMAGIPIVGPALGVAAAAAATAYGLEQIANISGVQLAVGTDYIPQDMVATVHQGEIIVPRTFSDALRSGDLSLSSPDYNVEETNNQNSSSNNNQTINIYVENNGNSIDELAETIRDVIAKNIAIGTIKPFPTKERM